MGCSPSKGKHFAGVCAQEDRALEFENNPGLQSAKTEQPENPISNGAALLENEDDWTDVPPQGQIFSPCIKATGNDVNYTSVYPGEPYRLGKTRKETSSPVRRKRCDPQNAVLKAHQEAFSYLNSNIHKYESILEIMDKARHTQLSLQHLVSLLDLQYEEINRTLEELGAKGEQLLEDQRINTAWSGKELDGEMCSESTDLLCHSINKISLVRDSVTGQGDAALEEAADYFGSLSHLLKEKLLGKRAAEARLNQVLSCIQAAALVKPSSKDSTLYSEDSGIGADNECQNGSGRLSSQQTRCGSGSSSSQNSSPDQLHVKEVEENKAQEDDNDVTDAEATSEEQEKTKNEHKKQRSMSLYSCELQDSLQNNRPAIGTVKRTEQRKKNINRPQTAGNPFPPTQKKPKHPHRSRSTDCLLSKVDVMVKGHHRNGNDCHKMDKQCFGDILPSTCQSVYAPEPPGRNAVKRLIHTFSQGVPNAPNQKPLTRPTSRYRGSKRQFLSRLTYGKDGISMNGSHPSHKRLSERPEDVNVDSLPPPPPELLMNNTFESNEGPPDDVEGQEDSDQREKSGVLCPRSKLQGKPLLPSRATISGGFYPRRLDNVIKKQFEEDNGQQANDDTERDDALYQHYSNSSGHQCIVNASPVGLRVQAAIRQGYRDTDEVRTAYRNPPVSRAQIPPLSNSVCPRLQSPPSLPPSLNGPVNSQWEASTAKSMSDVQRWTRRSSEEENGIMSDSDSLLFYDARSSQEIHSTSQRLRPSCSSTLPRPWGARGLSQATRLTQTFMRSIPSNDIPNLTHQ